TGVLMGFMMALPQFFYNRAYYLKYRETLGSASPQIILDEETAAGLEDSGDGVDRPFFQGGVAVPDRLLGGGGHHLVDSRFHFENPAENHPTGP
ncbi:MAG TPA: hypothetical protein PLA50_10735, partial [Bacteroidia bacterium]|nr:hypothetical protein [Bacteroidia bacterium]